MTNFSKPTNKPKKHVIPREKHQFHLVDSSQLPILTALSIMLVALSIVFYWHPSDVEIVTVVDGIVMHFAFILFTFTLLSWFIMIVRESQAGHHTAVVQQGLRLGIILFIASEVMFFFAFFWAFFHYSLSPSIFIGCVWPPLGIQPIDVWGLPFTNTLLLLFSGFTITIAHRYLSRAHNRYYHKGFARYLLATIILGITFLICQGIEYKYGITFSWKENVYGSIFFALTGFHGLHVTLGVLGLGFCLVRALLTRSGPALLGQQRHGGPFYRGVLWFYLKVIYPISVNKFVKFFVETFFPNKEASEIEHQQRLIKSKMSDEAYAYRSLIHFQVWLRSFGFSAKQHIGFEAAAWYWHFVDVVWLFLFLTVYWWGN